MFVDRVAIGILFVSALLFTAAAGWCAERNASIDNASINLDQQIAERIKQYQESLRQRAAQLSPSLQANIEAQAQQTVAEGLKKWEKGEIDIQIALPSKAVAVRLAQFIAQHLPFPGSPAGSLAFGNSLFSAVLTTTTVQCVFKARTIPVAHSTAVQSIGSFQQSDDVSYFIRVVLTIVKRQ